MNCLSLKIWCSYLNFLPIKNNPKGATERKTDTGSYQKTGSINFIRRAPVGAVSLRGGGGSRGAFYVQQDAPSDPAPAPLLSMHN